MHAIPILLLSPLPAMAGPCPKPRSDPPEVIAVHPDGSPTVSVSAACARRLTRRAGLPAHAGAVTRAEARPDRQVLALLLGSSQEWDTPVLPPSDIGRRLEAGPDHPSPFVLWARAAAPTDHARATLAHAWAAPRRVAGVLGARLCAEARLVWKESCRTPVGVSCDSPPRCRTPPSLPTPDAAVPRQGYGPSMSPLSLLLPVSIAADITVDPSRSPATVQEAVEIAASGDTIRIPAGTFVGCVDLGSKDLSLIGAGADQTALDGGGCPELIRARNSEHLVIESLGLTNAGGRCVAALGGTLEIVDSRIEGCGAEDISGSGVWARQADTTLDGVTVAANIGHEGAGVLSRNGGTLVIRHSILEDNVAAEQGAAVYGNGDIDGLVEDTTFRGNRTPERVAGAMAWHLGTLAIARTSFVDNAAAQFGGALYPHHVSEGVTLDQVIFENNTSTSGDGGAIAASMGTVLTVRDSRFTDNAARDGGAIWLSEGALTVEGSMFQDNIATADGGALAVTGSSPLVTTGSAFCGNSARDGGGIHLDGGRHRIANTWFGRNAASDTGGVIRAVDAEWTLGWASIVGTTASAGAAIDIQGGSLDLHSSLLAHTVSGGGIQAVDATVTGGWNAWWDNAAGDTLADAPDTGDEDVLAPPAMLRWSDSLPCDRLDLRLQRESPLFDAGHPDESDPDGSRADIGAWGGPLAVWEDVDGDGDAYPVDCDDTDPVIGPDCTERGGSDPDSGIADTGVKDTGPDGIDSGGTGAAPRPDRSAATCGCRTGVGAAALPLLLVLGLGRRRPASAIRPVD